MSAAAGPGAPARGRWPLRRGAMPAALLHATVAAASLALGVPGRSSGQASDFRARVDAVTLAAVQPVLEVWSERAHLADLGWSAVLWANVAAFFVGYASIAFLIRWLQTRSLAPFVVYRILLGLVLLGLMARGTLAPDAGLTTGPPSVSSDSR